MYVYICMHTQTMYQNHVLCVFVFCLPLLTLMLAFVCASVVVVGLLFVLILIPYVHVVFAVTVGALYVDGSCC